MDSDEMLNQSILPNISGDQIEQYLRTKLEKETVLCEQEILTILNKYKRTMKVYQVFENGMCINTVIRFVPIQS